MVDRGPPGYVKNGKEGVLKMMETRGLAFMGDKVANKVDLVMQNPELEYMPEELWRAGFGISLPKGSPYTKYFSEM